MSVSAAADCLRSRRNGHFAVMRRAEDWLAVASMNRTAARHLVEYNIFSLVLLSG